MPKVHRLESPLGSDASYSSATDEESVSDEERGETVAQQKKRIKEETPKIFLSWRIRLTQLILVYEIITIGLYFVFLVHEAHRTVTQDVSGTVWLVLESISFGLKLLAVFTHAFASGMDVRACTVVVFFMFVFIRGSLYFILDTVKVAWFLSSRVQEQDSCGGTCPDKDNIDEAVLVLILEATVLGVAVLFLISLWITKDGYCPCCEVHAPSEPHVPRVYRAAHLNDLQHTEKQSDSSGSDREHVSSRRHRYSRPPRREGVAHLRRRKNPYVSEGQSSSANVAPAAALAASGSRRRRKRKKRRRNAKAKDSDDESWTKPIVKEQREAYRKDVRDSSHHDRVRDAMNGAIYHENAAYAALIK